MRAWDFVLVADGVFGLKNLFIVCWLFVRTQPSVAILHFSPEPADSEKVNRYTFSLQNYKYSGSEEAQHLQVSRAVTGSWQPSSPWTRTC